MSRQGGHSSGKRIFDHFRPVCRSRCGIVGGYDVCLWYSRWASGTELSSTFPETCEQVAHTWGDRTHTPLRRRHNGRDSVSNHQHHDCLLDRLFRRRSKKTSKLRVIGLCAGNSLGTGEFPAQRASNAENFSIWWRLMTWADRTHTFEWTRGSWAAFQYEDRLSRHMISMTKITRPWDHLIFIMGILYWYDGVLILKRHLGGYSWTATTIMEMIMMITMA